MKLKKVFFKNEKTKKLKTVPFGETLMFSKSGSTESKFTQADLSTVYYTVYRLYSIAFNDSVDKTSYYCSLKIIGV